MQDAVQARHRPAHRVVVIDGKSWFVGKDVCDVLGYANATDAMDNHCRGVSKRYLIPDHFK